VRKHERTLTLLPAPHTHSTHTPHTLSHTNKGQPRGGFSTKFPQSWTFRPISKYFINLV